jgi:hypothetical protein
MVMARRTRLKISEDEFLQYLLDNYVDGGGNKVSDRQLWGSEEFFKKTGLFKKDKYSSKMILVSMGTVSYWKKKLNIDEHSIYHYHATITKRICETTFDEWSRKHNLGHKKKKIVTDLSRRSDLVKILNLSSDFRVYTVDMIIKYMRDIWRLANKDVDYETRLVMEKLDSIRGDD